MSRPIKIDALPVETEELIIVSLDDRKFGLSAGYTESAGLDQLSTFFIGLAPNGRYYVVKGSGIYPWRITSNRQG